MKNRIEAIREASAMLDALNKRIDEIPVGFNESQLYEILAFDGVPTCEPLQRFVWKSWGVRACFMWKGITR